MENANAWRETLAANLSSLRKKKGLTQAELGEKLNYSDKSISKWERGEGVPDLQVLMCLAELYNVSIDEMTGRRQPAPEVREAKKTRVEKRTFLMIMTESMIWLTAIIVFSMLLLLAPSIQRAWLAFIYALPAAVLCPAIYLSVWRLPLWAFGAFSLAGWMICVALQLTIGIHSAAVIYISGAALQLISLMVLGIVAFGRRKRR